MEQLNRRIREKIALDKYHEIKKQHNAILENELLKVKDKQKVDELIEFHDLIIKRAWDDYQRIKEEK